MVKSIGGSTIRNGAWGQCSFESTRNFGPENHSLFSTNARVDIERVMASAGLSRDGTCRQLEGSVCCSIIDTLFETKTGNRFFALRIICSTALESLQKVEVQSGICSALRKNMSSLTDNTAPDSSSRGIDIVFMGANRDLLIKREQ